MNLRQGLAGTSQAVAKGPERHGVLESVDLDVTLSLTTYKLCEVSLSLIPSFEIGKVKKKKIHVTEEANEVQRSAPVG